MASVSSASEISYVVCIATSFPHRCPAHSWIDNILFGHTHCTLVHNFSLLPPQLLFALQHLCFCSVESGDQQPGLSSIVIVTKCRFGVLTNVTIASHSLKDDWLKDLQVRILLKSFTSIQEMPPSPFVLKAACLTISTLISEDTDLGIRCRWTQRVMNYLLLGYFLF